MPSFFSRPTRRHARGPRRHDEGLDAAAAGALVDGGPHHDEAPGHLARAFAGGAEDLGAVQHPLVAVELGGGLDRGGVASGVRLGDGHRAPDRVAVALEGREEAQLLLVGAGRPRRRSRPAPRWACAGRARRRPSRAPRPARRPARSRRPRRRRARPRGGPPSRTSRPTPWAGRAPGRRTSARSAASARAPPCGSAPRPRVCSPPSRTRSAWLPQTSARASKLAKPRAFRSCISGRYSRV